MLKFSTRVMVFTLAACLLGATTPVSAYPPGTDMTANLDHDTVSPGGKVKLSVANANAKTKLTIKVGKGKATTYNTNGSLTVSLQKLITKVGIYKIVVTSPFNDIDDPEVVTRTLYVPDTIAPASGKIKSKTTVKFEFVQPGSVITLQVYAGKKKKKLLSTKADKKGHAVIVIPAKTFAKGKNTFVVKIDKQAEETLAFKGK